LRQADGHPEQARELRAQHVERPGQAAHGIAHVARQDQPILGSGGQRHERLAVDLVLYVHVAEREELHLAL
jgi:hypothetical protein